MKEKIQVKDMTKIAIFTALIAVGAFISVPIGPVPFTMQNFFVFMAGLLLPPVFAFSSVFLYILLGLVGIPIFAGFTGGPQVIVSPTFGFLIAFAVDAWFISIFCHGSNHLSKIIIVLLLSEVITYLLGLPYMYFSMTHFMNVPIHFQTVLSKGMIPFLLPDLVKLFIAAITAPKIYRGIKQLY